MSAEQKHPAKSFDAKTNDKIIGLIMFDNLSGFSALVNENNMNIPLRRTYYYTEHFSMLVCALDNGALDIVEYLLRLGVDVNAECDKNLWTALRQAISQKYEEIALELIERGADIDWANGSECTPLYEAVENDMHAMACYLLKKGADPNRGDSPLIAAILKLGNFHETTSLAMVQILIDYGADVNRRASPDDEVLTPLEGAVGVARSLRCVKMLHKAGCEIKGAVLPRRFYSRTSPKMRVYLKEKGAIWSE